MIVSIDNVAIDAGDIKSYPKITNKVSFNRNLIGSKADIVLDNTDGTYSDMNAASIFFGSNWKNKAVSVYDEAQKIYTWAGRIKNILVKDNDRTVVVKTANYVKELSVVNCVYSATGITPAAVVYAILKDVIGMSDAFINYSGFQDAINIQTAASVTMSITFTQKDNKKCMAVIGEILSITQCSLYTVNNIIEFYQWQEWDGGLGFTIKGKDYIPATLQTEYEEKVYNAYSIAYKSGSNVAYASDTISGTDGDDSFVVPAQTIDSTLAEKFKILFETKTAADWAGGLVLDRYQYPVKRVKFTLDETMNFITPNDQLDIYFGDYVREPIKITSIGIDTNSHKLKIAGYFLNLPVNVVSRDIEPPAPVELIAALPEHGGVFLKWTISTETDHLGYNIYLTASEGGQWNSEICNEGISPVEVKNPLITAGGFAYIQLFELNPGTEYFFKITSFDTSYNESVDSNVLECIPSDASDNLYCLAGNVYSDLTLDETNPRGGTVPTGFVTYDDINYDAGTYGITAIFESNKEFQDSCFSFWKFKGVGDIKYSYRESNDDITWDAWSAELDASGVNEIVLTKKYFQFRFIFYSENWTDSDNIYVMELK